MTPRPEVTRFVRNQSGRNGLKPSVIVVHTTEGHDRPGVGDLEALASWFDNPAASASSHVGNDAEGNDSRMVADERKAWTQGVENPKCLSIEQVAFARFTRGEWLKRKPQLRNTAEWIAYWSAKYDIPIRQSTSHGVCQHTDFPSQTHTDCGPGYPMDLVLSYAKTARNGMDPASLKERRWRRSLRIVRSKAARRGWDKPLRVRGRKLKALITRELKKRQ